MASIELGRLLAALRATASPVQRMKLVARAWRTVRRLNPTERRDLATHVGLEGTEELLERLASRGGSRLAPSLLLRALGRVRETEPGEVTRVLDTLRDPEGRQEMLRRGLEALAPEPEVEEPPPATPVEPPVDAAFAEPEPEPEAAEEEPPALPPVAPALAPTEPPAPPPSGPEVEEAQPPADGGGWAECIAAAPTLTERFRLLRRGLEEPGGLASGQIGPLLERFPAGWARRRALAALLRAGIPESLDQAVELIELLEAPRSRRWCASILLDRWPLTAGERGDLIQRHGLFRRRI